MHACAQCLMCMHACIDMRAPPQPGRLRVVLLSLNYRDEWRPLHADCTACMASVHATHACWLAGGSSAVRCAAPILRCRAAGALVRSWHGAAVRGPSRIHHVVLQGVYRTCMHARCAGCHAYISQAPHGTSCHPATGHRAMPRATPAGHLTSTVLCCGCRSPCSAAAAIGARAAT